MKPILTIMLAFIVSASFAQKKSDSSLFIHKFSDGQTCRFCDLLINEDPFTNLCIVFKKHKPIAMYSYTVFIRHHSLIIFKNGKKAGVFKLVRKPYQLTDLKLN